MPLECLQLPNAQPPAHARPYIPLPPSPFPLSLPPTPEKLAHSLPPYTSPNARIPTRRRACSVWWIQSVYVLPGHRRRGHFGALYRHVRDAARAAGAAGLRLYADDGNDKAHAVYRRLGMSSHYRVFEDMFTSY